MVRQLEQAEAGPASSSRCFLVENVHCFEGRECSSPEPGSCLEQSMYTNLVMCE